MDEDDFKRLLEDQGFSENQSKFFRAELDRLRTLEEGMADLQARVERLEQSSTH